MDELAKVLGVSVAEAGKRWKTANIDGDERYSIAYRHNIPLEVDVGRHSRDKYESGLEKLGKRNTDRLKTKRLVSP